MATKPTLELELYIHGQESTVGVLDGDGVAMATLAALQKGGSDFQDKQEQLA